MHKFRELRIWQRSMELAEEIHRLTSSFPKDEMYELTIQIRRSAVSIPSNISEGAGRNTNKQFRHFLEIAMGSCNELQTQLELARRFGYLNQALALKVIDECFQIYKMILVFYNSLSEN